MTTTLEWRASLRDLSFEASDRLPWQNEYIYSDYAHKFLTNGIGGVS